MDEGGQDPPSKGNGLYVWAVRSGDVAGVPLGNVPTPTTLLLMGLGLAGLGVVRRLR
ncbi:MAG: PEP-CTERM sorting domain-containing protein [Betaproteobacteria bacterium]|nr:PEP-CTERM sorting domain-containing protein [Betaproteobacteria bacterium]